MVERAVPVSTRVIMPVVIERGSIAVGVDKGLDEVYIRNYASSKSRQSIGMTQREKEQWADAGLVKVF